MIMLIVVEKEMTGVTLWFSEERTQTGIYDNMVIRNTTKANKQQ